MTLIDRYPKLKLKRTNRSAYWSELHTTISRTVFNNKITFEHELAYRLEKEGFLPTDAKAAIEFQLNPQRNPKVQLVRSEITIRGLAMKYYYKRNTYEDLRNNALARKSAVLDSDRGLPSPRKEDPLIEVVQAAIKGVNKRIGRNQFKCIPHRRAKQTTHIKIDGEIVEQQINGEIDVLIVDVEHPDRRFSIECKNWAEPIDSKTFLSEKQDFVRNLKRREFGLIPVFIARRAHFRVHELISKEKAYLVETEFQYYSPDTFEEVGRAMREELGYYFILPTNSPYVPPTQVVKGLEDILLGGK